jgi:hypothetical protein
VIFASAVLLALQAPPVAAVPPGPEPIVVVANRLDSVRYNLSVNRLTGQMKCRVARSSGRAAIDAYMCDVARYCARTARQTRPAIEQCIAERKRSYLSRYVQQRG